MFLSLQDNLELDREIDVLTIILFWCLTEKTENLG